MALPEQLRVRAVEGILAPVPGNAAGHGMQVEYVGRRTDHDAIKRTAKTRYDGVVMHGGPDECFPPDQEHNSTFSREFGIGVFGTLRRMLIDGDIEAVDEETARWAGLSVGAEKTKQATAKPKTELVSAVIARGDRESK